jgi:hypothetical protein
VALAAPAEAKGTGVHAAGHCSARTVSAIKAKQSNSRIEIEFQVDSNRNGQRWSVKIRQDAALKMSGVRRTVAPSGAFTVVARIADAPGVHRITGVATNLTTGEVCRATVSI